jgi:uncharacterized membrane protein
MSKLLSLTVEIAMALNNRSRVRQIVYLVLVFGCLAALISFITT